MGEVHSKTCATTKMGCKIAVIYDSDDSAVGVERRAFNDRGICTYSERVWFGWDEIKGLIEGLRWLQGIRRSLAQELPEEERKRLAKELGDG